MVASPWWLFSIKADDCVSRLYEQCAAKRLSLISFGGISPAMGADSEMAHRVGTKFIGKLFRSAAQAKRSLQYLRLSRYGVSDLLSA